MVFNRDFDAVCRARLGARESCPQTQDKQRRMTLEHHLLEGARKDRVANVLWTLSTQTKMDPQERVIPFEMEVADRLNLGSIFRLTR